VSIPGCAWRSWEQSKEIKKTKEGIKYMKNGTVLRALVDLRDRTLQKSRIAFSLRMSAIERGADQMDDSQQKIIEHWMERFDELETEVDGQIADFVKDIPIVQTMTKIKGIGLLLGAKVIAMIDIERATTVSALWRYAGYGVKDGEREKPVKGEKLHYNARLKTTCYLVATSFLRCNSPYRQIYDSAKEFYQTNRAEWTKLHVHNAAMRKMIKVWLSHLWLKWREMEGLSTRDLYVIEHMDHEHYLKPEDFGW
jgi:hypothetical protein